MRFFLLKVSHADTIPPLRCPPGHFFSIKKGNGQHDYLPLRETALERCFASDNPKLIRQKPTQTYAKYYIGINIELTDK
jgi:hypothetical protein